MSIKLAKQHIKNMLIKFEVDINMSLPLQSISSTNDYSDCSAENINDALNEMQKDGEITLTDNHNLIRNK